MQHLDIIQPQIAQLLSPEMKARVRDLQCRIECGVLDATGL